MRSSTFCMAMCLALVAGRAAAEVPSAVGAEPTPAVVTDAVYYAPPAYHDWRPEPRPWTGNAYGTRRPRAPSAYSAPRYRTDRSYGEDRGYRPYSGFGSPPVYRPYWPAERYAQRPWQQLPGYWSRTPDYRWAGNDRARMQALPNQTGYRGGYWQRWRW